MKKIFALVALLVACLNAAVAANITITIHVDNPANVEVSQGATGWSTLPKTVFPLQAGDNEITTFVDDFVSPLHIVPLNGKTTDDVVVMTDPTGCYVEVSSGGNYINVSDLKAGYKVTIQTEKVVMADPVVTFTAVSGTADNLRFTDEQGQPLTLDENGKCSVRKNAKVNVEGLNGWSITKVDVDPIALVTNENGVYTLVILQDLQAWVYMEKVAAVATFDVDYPGRVAMKYSDTQEAIDITSGRALVKYGKPLSITSADATKYEVTAVTMNGMELTKRGDAFNTGISQGVETAAFVIRTSSTVPGVRFAVNYPDYVTATVVGTDEVLDLTKTYELEEGTTLAFRPANDQVRITSLTVNGSVMPDLGDGTYRVYIDQDALIEINAKTVQPYLAFQVDAPERVRVYVDADIIDLSTLAEPLEVTKGATLTIEAAADNFDILSVTSNGTALNKSGDGKYHTVAMQDLAIDIKTQATLTLNIAQPAEGGTLAVWRNGTELANGAQVKTGDVLTLTHTVEDGYLFLYYTLDGAELDGATYVVEGSTDFTLGVNIRKVADGCAVVRFDIPTFLINISEYQANEKWVRNLSRNEVYEVPVGNLIRLRINSVGIYFAYCTVNGVDATPDPDPTLEEEGKAFLVEVDGNMLIKADIEKRVSVYGETTWSNKVEEDYRSYGKVNLKYNGEEGYKFIVPLGGTVELVAYPEEGYLFDYFCTDRDLMQQYFDNKYTVTQADIDAERTVIFWGKFSADPNSIRSIETSQSFYDASTATLFTTGGRTTVYSLSGEEVLTADDRCISLGGLPHGTYLVKTQDGVLKVMK